MAEWRLEPGVRRIAILGASGAGKSTLAAKLAARTGLPLIHLDREYWQPGWVETAKPDWHARNVRIAEGAEWIIDGNYGRTIPLRLARADVAIWLDLPTAICLWGVVRRTLAHHGRPRPDMGEGCPERFNFAFLRYVVRFRRASRPVLAARLAEFGGTVIHLTSRRQIAAFLAAQA